MLVRNQVSLLCLAVSLTVIAKLFWNTMFRNRFFFLCSLYGYMDIMFRKKYIVREAIIYTSFLCHTSDLFIHCHIILMIGQNYAVYRKVCRITKVLTS